MRDCIQVSDPSIFGLLGDGGQAQEVAEYVSAGLVAFRAVSSEYLAVDRNDLIDIDTTDPIHLATPVLAAIGAPALRRTLVGRWAGFAFRSLIAPTAWVARSASIAPGTLIAPGAVVSVRTTIGGHVIVNLRASISHDTIIEDYVTISPGVSIAGKCFVGAGSFLGIGSTISSGIRVASGTVVGAGATVIGDTEPNGVYVGVPARQVGTRKGWLNEV